MNKLLKISIVICAVVIIGAFYIGHKVTGISQKVQTPEIEVPQGYTADRNYNYHDIDPSKNITGIKFTIPASMSTGTNLASDTYISLEALATSTSCDPSQFMYQNVKSNKISDGGKEYILATSSEAAAGNRYEEAIYVFPDTNPCLAVRYVIHYGVFENYPTGTAKIFDKDELLSEFDKIRRTVTY